MAAADGSPEERLRRYERLTGHDKIASIIDDPRGESLRASEPTPYVDCLLELSFMRIGTMNVGMWLPLTREMKPSLQPAGARDSALEP